MCDNRPGSTFLEKAESEIKNQKLTTIKLARTPKSGTSILMPFMSYSLAINGHPQG